MPSADTIIYRLALASMSGNRVAVREVRVVSRHHSAVAQANASIAIDVVYPDNLAIGGRENPIAARLAVNRS